MEAPERLLPFFIDKTILCRYTRGANDMPIKITSNMPVIKKLEEESIFVMTEERAVHQDIRELRIAIINLIIAGKLLSE